MFDRVLNMPLYDLHYNDRVLNMPLYDLHYNVVLVVLIIISVMCATVIFIMSIKIWFKSHSAAFEIQVSTLGEIDWQRQKCSLGYLNVVCPQTSLSLK